MASSSLTVIVEGDIIRKFGGNRSEVRNLLNRYNNLTSEELMKKHPYINEGNIKEVDFFTRFNKK